MLVNLALILAVLGFAALGVERINVFAQEEKWLCNWECMTLALLWPGAFCMSLKYDTSDCVIPKNIQNWTIHGLWPLRKERCCECWPIFPSDLKELEPELSQLWPTLIKRPNFTFWRNEWIKHGSCAACKEGMNSPTRYFQVSLKLRRHFNIDAILNTAGIVPSCNNPYKIGDLREVLDGIFGDKHEIQCVTDDTGREVWFQVKIYLYQNFTLGCHTYGQGKLRDAHTPWSSSSGHPCPEQGPVFYFPINYEDPLHPCD